MVAAFDDLKTRRFDHFVICVHGKVLDKGRFAKKLGDGDGLEHHLIFEAGRSEAGGFAYQEPPWPQSSLRSAQSAGDVLYQMKQIEREHRIEPVMRVNTVQRRVRFETQIGQAGLGNLAARDGDHGAGDIGAVVGFDILGQQKRGRAGAASNLQNRVIGAQIAACALQCVGIGRHVPDRISGVFLGDIIPEACIGFHCGLLWVNLNPCAYGWGIAVFRLCVMQYRMNWQAISFDWNHARAFLAVVEAGSLSGAARLLHQTQPTVGRQITALETELGVTLFERAGRSLKVTQTGLDLAEHVRAMAEGAARISMVASGQSQAVEGLVRIAASELFAAYLLPPILRKLRVLAPKIDIDVVASNSISDLVQREADVAVRNVRPEQPDLIARLVHEASGRFYAAKSYLDKSGRPRRLEDLKAHDFVSFGDTAEMIGHLRQLGIELAASNFKIGSSNSLVAWEMVKQGFGIAPMSVDVARKSPELETLLPDSDPILFPTWLVTHRELHTSRRIRLVFDLLAEELPKHMA